MPDDDMPRGETELQADLLVIGGGMAGMTAAGAAARGGATVIVVEKSPDIGGSAALSEGYVWTAPDMATLLDEDPEVNVDLGRALVEGAPDALEWLERIGAPLGDHLANVFNFGVGRRLDIPAYLAACRGAVEANGGWVLCSTTTESLTVAAGRITGAVVHRDDETARLSAAWTLLATGGFQADAGKVRQYINPEWRDVLLRAGPHSTGDGIRLGVAAGAAASEEMRGFYGHLMPAPLARELTPTDFTALTQYYSEHGILAGQDGRRFTDESRGDHYEAEALAARATQRAVLVGDEWIRRELITKPFIAGMDANLDKVSLAADAGARVARAGTIDALCAEVGRWGYDGQVLRETITAFNAAMDAAGHAALAVPRRRFRRAVAEPPLFAIEVQPAITFTYGGLLADADGHALDASGQPVPGLLVAGVDVGGFYHRGYGGGLVRGLVSGRRAAATAAQPV